MRTQIWLTTEMDGLTDIIKDLESRQISQYSDQATSWT